MFTAPSFSLFIHGKIEAAFNYFKTSDSKTSQQTNPFLEHSKNDLYTFLQNRYEENRTEEFLPEHKEIILQWFLKSRKIEGQQNQREETLRTIFDLSWIFFTKIVQETNFPPINSAQNLNEMLRKETLFQNELTTLFSNEKKASINRYIEQGFIETKNGKQYFTTLKSTPFYITFTHITNLSLAIYHTFNAKTQLKDPKMIRWMTEYYVTRVNPMAYQVQSLDSLELTNEKFLNEFFKNIFLGNYFHSFLNTLQIVQNESDEKIKQHEMKIVELKALEQKRKEEIENQIAIQKTQAKERTIFCKKAMEELKQVDKELFAERDKDPQIRSIAVLELFNRAIISQSEFGELLWKDFSKAESAIKELEENEKNELTKKTSISKENSKPQSSLFLRKNNYETFSYLPIDIQEKLTRSSLENKFIREKTETLSQALEVEEGFSRRKISQALKSTKESLRIQWLQETANQNIQDSETNSRQDISNECTSKIHELYFDKIVEEKTELLKEFSENAPVISYKHTPYSIKALQNQTQTIFEPRLALKNSRTPLS